MVFDTENYFFAWHYFAYAARTVNMQLSISPLLKSPTCSRWHFYSEKLKQERGVCKFKDILWFRWAFSTAGSFSKITNNTAQRADSTIYEILVYNLWLTPELSTLKLLYACWYHKTAFRKENPQPHPPKADSSPKANYYCLYHSVLKWKMQ